MLSCNLGTIMIFSLFSSVYLPTLSSAPMARKSHNTTQEDDETKSVNTSHVAKKQRKFGGNQQNTPSKSMIHCLKWWYLLLVQIWEQLCHKDYPEQTRVKEVHLGNLRISATPFINCQLPLNSRLLTFWHHNKQTPWHQLIQSPQNVVSSNSQR